MGAASGTTTLLRTVGGSLGVAVLGSVHASRMSAELTDRLGSDGAHRTGGPVAPALLRDLPTSTQDAVRTAVTGGLHGVALGTAALCAVTCAAAWLIREAPCGRTRPSRAAERRPVPPVGGRRGRRPWPGGRSRRPWSRA